MAKPKAESGVYRITCTANGRVYVGSAVDISRRWRQHLWALNSGRHENPKLLNSWKKHGKAAFVFELIAHVPVEQLIDEEQRWIVSLRACGPNGFNVTPVAGSMLGFKHSDETRAKIAATKKGRSRSEETRARMREAQKRRGPIVFSPEALIKMSPRGRKHSEETKAKIGAAGKGRVMPDSHRQALSAYRKAHPCTAEQMARCHAGSRGKKKSPEFCAWISEFNKTRVYSPESRAKMSASAKARCRRKAEQAKEASGQGEFGF